MAFQGAIRVEFGAVFSDGAYAAEKFEMVRDFDRSSWDRVIQQIDKVTGLPLWVVEVIDADEAARQRTVKVKVAATVQPVLPSRRVPRRHGQDPLPAPACLDDPGPGRPEILTPPENPPACCTRQTLTVPPQVAAKTAQNTTTRPPRTAAPTPAAPAPNAASPPPRTPSATTSAAAGAASWACPPMLAIACVLVVRNQRILQAWDARQKENERRAAKGLPPKTRRQRRKTLTALAGPP